MNQLSRRFDLLVARLNELGIARTADDLRVVANDLRDMPDARLDADAPRVGPAIDRLTRIYLGLAQGGYPQLADELKPLLDELRHAHQSSTGG